MTLAAPTRPRSVSTVDGPDPGAAGPAPPLHVRDVVGVRPHPTVVRLEDLEGRDPGWISETYCITGEVRGHLDALRRVFERPGGCGIFLVGQYGCGKSHFLAYVTQKLRDGSLVPTCPEPVPVSLLNFRGDVPLEDAVGAALGLRPAGPDRRAAWSDRFRGGGGVLLILDELSEFLRSKPDARRFNEDVRFLQFMGEWAQGRPFWVLAAVQEQVEHMGDLEHGSYRKIKDRFPLRLLLTPAHVRDLIGQSILLKKEGYREAVAGLAAGLREAFPASPYTVEDFQALYPIHPATLELLEEVRDRFSQARGVVDFTVRQLAGDPARGIPPFLDRPFGSLVSPDAIVDHFGDLFETQPEFLPLAQQVLPYYRKHLERLFTTPAQQELAAKVVKLLILAHLSPSRDGLTAAEAACWLLYKGTRLDPDRNVETVERVLRTLAGEAGYVASARGRYRLDLRDDGGAALERLVRTETADLAARGEEVFEILAPLLGEEGLNPFTLPRDQWQSRTVRWHFHEQPYAVYLGSGDPDPPARAGVALCVRLPWGEAGGVPGVYTLVPARIEVLAEHLELAALVRVQQRSPGSQDARRVQARIQDRLHLWRTQVRGAYLEAALLNPLGATESPPRFEPPDSTRAWLDRHAEWMLRHTYPAFEKFAPAHGPLPTEAYRRFMRFAAAHDLGEADADEYVQIIREGYLVPMGLLQRKGREYAAPARPEKNELVRLVLPLLEHQPSPKVVYEHLAQPVYGLVPDQTGVLLIYLLVAGVLDIQKGRQSYRDLFDMLPNPIQYDRLAPGRGLSAEQVRSLEKICQGLGIGLPRGWTVPEQRRTLGRLREAARAQAERLQALLVKLEGLRRDDATADHVRTMLAQWRLLEQGDDALASFEEFLSRVESTGAFLELHASLQKLPERIDRLISEVKRFEHLLGKALMEHCIDMDLIIRIESLGDPPGLDNPEALEEWLGRAGKLYGTYKAGYARGHDEWWRALEAHPAWAWQPPAVARSRHLGLDEALGALDRARAAALKMRCRGLVNLDFQPVCTCGFDGETAPIREELARFDQARERIEEALRRFFEQEPVRARLREWVEGGLERNAVTQAYLEGRAPVPQVDNLELYDRHMAGVELVKELDVGPVVELLTDRTWERRALVAAFDQLLGRSGAARLRFAGSRIAAGALPRWCAEQALRHGIALPGGLSAMELAEIAEAIEPAWVGPAALERLEELGLPEAAADRVAGWVLEGRVRAARPAASPLVGAALELLEPGAPRSPRELGSLAARLYGRHERLLRIAGARWLERLDRLATTPATGDAPPLVEALRGHEDAQWVVIDGLGVALLDALMTELEELFPSWRAGPPGFALVDARTTTATFYEELVRAGFNRPFEKIDGVDRLLHEGFRAFDDLCRFAAAELHPACRKLLPRLDPGRPVLLLADHGFRIAPDGRSYTHGGPSTLERLVPLVRLTPGPARPGRSG